MERYVGRLPPCARAMIIYLSGSSSPTLPIKVSMAMNGLPAPKRAGHPPIAHCHCPRTTPVSFRGAHGVLRRTCYGLEASTGFLGHGASTQQRCVGDKRACFVVASLQAKWRSSKNAKTSAFWWSKQIALAFLLLLFRKFCHWSETTAESCVVKTKSQIQRHKGRGGMNVSLSSTGRCYIWYTNTSWASWESSK